MDSLPTETILHIISFLSGRDLKHSSLVSTRFTHLAQQALFKTVKILTAEGTIGSKEFVDFVDVVVKRPRLGLMIKRLVIGARFDQCLHYQPLVQLLEQVHNLRELLCNLIASPPSIPFRPHQFPHLYRIKWPLLGSGTDILHTILPYSPVVDLSLYCCPTRLQFNVAFATLLKLSPPKWVNNLVRYAGTPYLIEGLSEDAKLLHFRSSNSLSSESLQGIASKRLLSLHAISLGEQYIPPSLLPSLFPNLQSIMWFTVQLSSALLYKFQDHAIGALIACLRQLCDLRRVGLSFVFSRGNTYYGRFITDLQEFVQEHSPRLESIHTRGSDGSLRKYARQRNARNDLMSWEVENNVFPTPQFVDRW